MMVDQRVGGSNEPVWDSFENAAVHELVEQAHRGQYEVVQGHARESANGYTEFLESLFLYYRESVRATENRAKEADKHSMRPS